MNQVQVTAMFNLAGLEILSLTQVRNDYWPSHENYDEVRKSSPWWEVGTPEGMIRIGWRKRVIEIDWITTKRRGEVTTDDVTKNDHMVHAYSVGDAITYLSRIRQLPIQEIVNPDEKTYLIHGKKDVEMTVRCVLEESLTEVQKAMLGLVLSEVTDCADQVTVRVARTEDCVTLKIKTAKVYLEIQP